MAKFIQFGKWNKPNKYILFLIIFNVGKDFSFGSHYVENFQYLKVFDCGALSNSYYIHQIFCYFITSILAIFTYRKEYKNINNNSVEYSLNKLENKINISQSLDIELIHNKQEIQQVYPNKYLLTLIIIWVLNEEILNYFNTIFIHLDFWMLELIIITIFMYKILNLKIYKHQKLMLYLTSIPFILKLMTIIYSFLDENNYLDENDLNNYRYSDEVDKLKIIYVSYPWLVALGFIFYLFLIIIRSYVNTKIKWLIDLKYISPNKILIMYGVIGTIFCFFISLIATFISCGEVEQNSKKYDFNNYFCKVKYDNNKYLESFKTFFSSSLEDKQIIQETITVIIGIISFFGYRFFSLMIIESLTPIHLIFSFPIYYLLNKSYLSVINVIKNGSAFVEGIKYVKEKCILDFCSDFISILGYLIYLDIIELNFCGLDFNLRREILQRGDKDKKRAQLNNSNNSGYSGITSGRNSSIGQISESSLDDSDF